MKNNNKIIFCIVGRTASGKDSITNRVAKDLGIPIVCSFTDRPKRPTEVDGREHQFISQKEMDRLCKYKDNLLAYTQIGETGYRYCVPKNYISNMIGQAVFYIIDPKGIEYLKENCPEYDLKIISVQADEDIRKDRAILRNGESKSYQERVINENKQFSDFENNPLAYDICIDNSGNLSDAVDELTEFVSNTLKNKTNSEQKDLPKEEMEQILNSVIDCIAEGVGRNTPETINALLDMGFTEDSLIYFGYNEKDIIYSLNERDDF